VDQGIILHEPIRRSCCSNVNWSLLWYSHHNQLKAIVLKLQRGSAFGTDDPAPSARKLSNVFQS
jgi:hypothetical protein